LQKRQRTAQADVATSENDDAGVAIPPIPPNIPPAMNRPAASGQLTSPDMA
jgi:hypothetical protein